VLKNVTSPTEYALLVGGVQLKALKVLAGLNPVIEAGDIVRVLNASMRYMVMQGVVNSTRITWDALISRTSCQVMLNYVALSIARTSKGNSSLALRALTAIATFQEALVTHRYGDARRVMHEVAENTSLIAAAYMACQLPPRVASKAVNPPGAEGLQENSFPVISAEDMLKAVAVLERLGPRAVTILSKVPVIAVISAVSKVPLNVLRNMSVDEIVKAIETASSINTPANLSMPTVGLPKEGQVIPQGAGPGRGTEGSNTSTSWEEKPPMPRYWVRPQPGNPSRVRGSTEPVATEGTSSVALAATQVVRTLAEVIKSASLPPPPITPAVGEQSLTRVRGGLETVAEVKGGAGTAGAHHASLLALILGGAVFTALALTLMVREKPSMAGPGQEVVVSELPAVVREFWEAVNVVSKVSGIEIRGNLTHREIVREALASLKAEAGRALLRLATLYEGVRYAGVEVTREVSSAARELLQEVIKHVLKAE